MDAVTLADDANAAREGDENDQSEPVAGIVAALRRAGLRASAEHVAALARSEAQRRPERERLRAWLTARDEAREGYEVFDAFTVERDEGAN